MVTHMLRAHRRVKVLPWYYTDWSYSHRAREKRRWLRDELSAG